MSNTTAIVPIVAAPIVPTLGTVESFKMLAKMAVGSGMAKTKNEYDAFFIIVYGYELGIAPMTALRTIYSVSGGAPTCSGEAMLALIRRSGLAEIIKLPTTEEILKDKVARVYMKRRGGEEYTAVYAWQDAERAGLTGKSNWKAYPAQMLLWRAVAIGAKALFSDVIGGLYTVEEIAPDTPVDETGAPVGEIAPVTVERVNTQTGEIVDAAPEPPPAPKIEPERARALLGGNGGRSTTRPPIAPPEGYVLREELDTEKPSTANAVVSYVEVRITETGKPYIVAEGGLTAFTREPFRSAGIDCESWIAPGEKHILEKPVLVRYQEKGDYKTIIEVMPAT